MSEETTEELSTEDQVMLPVSAEQLRALGVDNVPDGKVYGIVFTPNDIKRGYYRWKTLLGAPEVYKSEILDSHTSILVGMLDSAKKANEEALEKLECSQQHVHDKLGKITELEIAIDQLKEHANKIQSNNKILQDLADKRLMEVEHAKRGTASMQQKIERYRRQYGDTDRKYNWAQKIVMIIFRIDRGTDGKRI